MANDNDNDDIDEEMAAAQLIVDGFDAASIRHMNSSYSTEVNILTAEKLKAILTIRKIDYPSDSSKSKLAMILQEANLTEFQNQFETL